MSVSPFALNPFINPFGAYPQINPLLGQNPLAPQLPQAPRSPVQTNKTGQSFLDLADQILQATSSFCAIKQASVGILAGGFGGGFGGGGINPFASPLGSPLTAYPQTTPRFTV